MATNSDTMAIGKKLVELCNAGRNLEAIDTLYAADVVSLEAMNGSPAMPARMEGIDAIRGKNKWWTENHEVHSGSADGPYPNGDRFVVFFKYDVTGKAGPMAGHRIQMIEAALYTVRGGKIAQEEFFYSMG